MKSAKPPYVNGMGDNHALIDAMVQPAAVLGADGRVMAVNSAWRNLAEDGELAAFSLGTGSARTSGCDCGHRDACELSEVAAEGIIDVLCGAPINWTDALKAIKTLIGRSGYQGGVHGVL